MDQTIYQSTLSKHTDKSTNLEIKCNIPLIKYSEKIGGDIKEVINKLIRIIYSEIISKQLEYDYYIEGQYGDYLPSPFSNSNTIDFIVPHILYDMFTYKNSTYTFNMRFFSNTKKFDFFESKNNPIYVIEIINLK